MELIKNILVLGGGSAGFMAALTLKRRRPHLRVRLLRDPALGIIGVGEGTTPYFPSHLHEYLGLKEAKFYAEARPIWKLGIRYLWGPRPSFNYTFSPQTDFRHPQLSRNNGYYCTEDFSAVNEASALMDAGTVFPRQPDGAPVVREQFGYHVENSHLVAYLEARCRDFGVEVADATITGVQRGPAGTVTCLQRGDGGVEPADLFVDASGFFSELMGKALEEPFVDFRDSLFCDRAVVGGWARQRDEPIQPFTTAETMEAGWAWRIDHEEIINRGYVFSSDHLDDDGAEAEFRRKNPRVNTTRVVRFRSGRYRRNWVHNVVAVGNAAGFVEPLEATALLCICLQSRALADGLEECDDSPSPSMAHMYNRYMEQLWEDIREFLAVHYRYNRQLDSPFWQRCREETALHGAGALMEYYRENGPSGLARAVLVNSNSPFGIEGYYTLLTGMQVPFDRKYKIPSAEQMKWDQMRRHHQRIASNAYNVRQALDLIRSPRWKWAG